MFPDYLQKFEYKKNDYNNHQIGSFVTLFSAGENYKKAIGLVSIQRHQTKDKNQVFAKGVREELYRMYHEEIPLVDVGDLKQGNTIKDTDIAIADIIKNLHNMFGKLIVITDDETYMEKAVSCYSKSNYLQENTITVSPQKQDIIIDGLLEENGHKHHLNIMGFQNYYFPPEALSVLHEHCHEAYRLGFIKENMEMAETLLRRSDLFYFSMGAIRNSDFCFSEEPNGFKSDEACKLMHYAGYSHQIKQVIIGNYSEDFDEKITARKLLAQMVWHVVNSNNVKVDEHPETHAQQFVKYTTSLQHEDLPLFFYQSRLSKRWWMEMEHPQKGTQNTKNLIVPCTAKDYDAAVGGETPELWWVMTNRYASPGS